MKSATVITDEFKQRMVEAMRLHTAGDMRAAQKIYESLLKQYPEEPLILKALSTIYIAKAQWKHAAFALRKLLQINARQPEQIFKLAEVEIEMGHEKDARETFAKLLMIDPTNEAAIERLCDLCEKETPKDDIGKSPLYALIEAFPKALSLHSVGIKLCRRLEDRTFRLQHLEAIRKGAKPDGDQFFIEYGAMLRDNHRFKEAFEVANDALKTYPDTIDLLRLRGSLYITFGEHAKALADAYRVYELAPDNHQAFFAIGLIKLLVSDCTDGFTEFRGLRDRSFQVHNLAPAIPEWQGEDISGKHLVYWANEGIGDIIMYASFLPYILSQGARVSGAVPEKLSLLFSRSFPEVPLMPMLTPGVMEYAQARGDYFSTISQFVPLMLPHYTPAEHTPYLKADAKKTAALREKYQRLFGDKKRIGISWFTKNQDSASRRNIPLEEWAELFSLPHVQFISLQYGDHAREIAAANARQPGALYVDDSVDAYEDIDALATQMMAMDEIITIDNTTIHLAGALGVKATLLLSCASEWRWGLHRTDTRWYESVTLLRQQDIRDWGPELRTIYDRLKS